MQHDCQEFLAFLLDTLHEELNVGRGRDNNYKAANRSDCGTSMELHTSHSVDVAEAASAKSLGAETNNSGGAVGRPSWPPESSSSSGNETAGSKMDPHHHHVRGSVGAGVTSSNLSDKSEAAGDGTESRGSASPKSYDSHSSIGMLVV